MTDWVRGWHRYRRQNRFLLGAFVVLLVLSLLAVYLLERTQQASPRELTNRLLLFLLWYLDISLILVLCFILARNLIRLAVERRSGVLGSRFRTRLVLSYVGLTLLPVLFVFLLATNFLQQSIERWFSTPVEAVLRGGAEMTVELRRLVEERLVRQGRVAAGQLDGITRPGELARLQGLLGVDFLALYRGTELVEAVADPRRISGSVPPLRWLELEPSGVRAERWRGGLLIRAWVPAGNLRVVVGDILPREVLLHLERATAADATFQEMKLERRSIASTTVLVFLAVTLLLLFAAVWLGLYLSRRFTEPLLAVAAATQRVAEGDRLEEVDIPATDEVAVLVHSFNAMVRRVRSTEAEIRASNQELTTLLATVPTGVLTVTADGCRFRPNPAAARILGQSAWVGEWQDLEALRRPGLEPLWVVLGRPEELDRKKQVELTVRDVQCQVEVSASHLPDGGYVVAVDDLTALVRAQRQAAWSEVARRIAHEIKNPLTPIRLAAERIQRRAGKLEGEVGDVVTSGCQAITAHVAGLKDLVDAFHQYARMPAVQPQPWPLNRLLRDVASLYQDLRDGLDIRVDVPAQELIVLVDPVLLRQALVNLIDNAVEATPSPGWIVLAGRAEDADLVVEVKDSGIGLPTDELELLVQPFYSTKGRGSGMGLALVHRIVTEHGGTLSLLRLTPQGTVARMVFRRALQLARTSASGAIP